MAVMHAKEYQSYKQTEIETASPGKLLLLLYDGAIKRLHLAKEELEQNRREECHLHLVRVQEILVELMLALDWDVEGELAARLHGLYDYMYRQLVRANVRKDQEIIDEVIQLLTTLREGWNDAFRHTVQNGEKPSSQAPPSSKINLQG
jgi:flagellar secretion chaperone FliS